MADTMHTAVTVSEISNFSLSARPILFNCFLYIFSIFSAVPNVSNCFNCK